MPKTTKTVTERGQSEPPKKLADLIELVNAEWPFERELPNMHAGFEPAMEAYSRDTSVSARDLWAKTCDEAADALSPDARAFLGPPARLEAFLDKFTLLKSAREVLLGIARRSRAGSVARSSGVTIRVAEFSVDVPFSAFVNLVVNDQGKLAVSTTPVLDALVGVRADRIRLCVICGRIFWAARVNSECCSERCRKTHNKRTSRKNRQFRRRKAR